MTRHIGRGFGTGTHARARRGAHGGVTPSKTPHPQWQHKRDYPYVKLSQMSYIHAENMCLPCGAEMYSGKIEGRIEDGCSNARGYPRLRCSTGNPRRDSQWTHERDAPLLSFPPDYEWAAHHEQATGNSLHYVTSGSRHQEWSRESLGRVNRRTETFATGVQNPRRVSGTPLERTCLN